MDDCCEESGNVVVCRKWCCVFHGHDEVRHGLSKKRISLAWAGNIISFVVGWLLFHLHECTKPMAFLCEKSNVRA